jgi:hypothetical protein
VQVSPPFITTDEELHELVAAIEAAVIAQDGGR